MSRASDMTAEPRWSANVQPPCRDRTLPRPRKAGRPAHPPLWDTQRGGVIGNPLGGRPRLTGRKPQMLNGSVGRETISLAALRSAGRQFG